MDTSTSHKKQRKAVLEDDSAVQQYERERERCV